MTTEGCQPQVLASFIVYSTANAAYAYVVYHVVLPWASQHALRQGPLKSTPNSNASSVTKVRQTLLIISPRKAILRNARYSVQHPFSDNLRLSGCC